jgi:hypothetical protein
VKYWEVIADRLHAEGWSYGIAEHFTKHGFLFCVDAHRDGKRFIVKADDLLTAFLSLERDARASKGANGNATRQNVVQECALKFTAKGGVLSGRALLFLEDRDEVAIAFEFPKPVYSNLTNIRHFPTVFVTPHIPPIPFMWLYHGALTRFSHSFGWHSFLPFSLYRAGTYRWSHRTQQEKDLRLFCT